MIVERERERDVSSVPQRKENAKQCLSIMCIPDLSNVSLSLLVSCLIAVFLGVISTNSNKVVLSKVTDYSY